VRPYNHIRSFRASGGLRLEPELFMLSERVHRRAIPRGMLELVLAWMFESVLLEPARVRLVVMMNRARATPVNRGTVVERIRDNRSRFGLTNRNWNFRTQKQKYEMERSQGNKELRTGACTGCFHPILGHVLGKVRGVSSGNYLRTSLSLRRCLYRWTYQIYIVVFVIQRVSSFLLLQLEE